MPFSVMANRQRALLAVALASLAVLGYILHRTEIKVTIFGSHSGSCIKQSEETEKAFCRSFIGNKICQRDPSAPCTVWVQQRRKEQEMKDILMKLDQKMPSITFRDVKTTTSAKNSKATLLSHKDAYCVGDHLTVRLDMYDHSRVRKRYGGDFLRARVYSPSLKAGASGHVEDYRNGTYLVNFTLFWEGDVRVSILLIHPSEGVSAMWAARKKGYGKIAFTGKFLNGSSDVFTECGFNITTKEELCEYLDERDQEAFYCVKPKHVPCEAFTHLKSNNRPVSYLTALEKSLFNRSNIGVEIPQTFGNIRVLSCNMSETPAREKCRMGMGSSLPSGYVLQNNWHPAFCSLSDFSTLDKIHACLKRKMIYLMGDSTLRQWIYSLTAKMTSTKAAPREKCAVGMRSPTPSGFVWQTRWHPAFCTASWLSTPDQINTCLEGKLVYFMGDSTVRQWMEHLTKTVRTLKLFDMHGIGKLQNLFAVDLARNIQVQWKKHGHPIITANDYTAKDHSYVARDIDKVAGDRDTVVVISLGQHFRPFPIERFLRRMLNVRAAIQRLLLRSPDTKVIIKAENIREMWTDPERFGDIHGYTQYLALRAIFRHLSVGFIDMWDMSIAYATNNVHPPEEVVRNQINMFFTYIC